MRTSLKLTAGAALGIAIGFPLPLLTSAQAADTASASQIINQLTPSGTMTTRGIRLGGQPPEAAKPATPASTGGMARPQPAERVAESNLTVPFASGSSTISPAAAHVLDQLGEALSSPKLAEFKFRVEGHTDTVGSPELNKALSDQRAASVADYLVTKFKIDRARLTPVGMGQEGLLIATGPGVPNAANRRVLVVNLGH
jgi:outer membrane protein OmpA-like peptidoglycan-associated protein